MIWLFSGKNITEVETNANNCGMFIALRPHLAVFFHSAIPFKAAHIQIVILFLQRYY